MPLNLEGSEKKSTSYSFHDCVEESLVLVFLSVPVHTDASTQYWSHFHLKRRISSHPALLCVLSIGCVPLLFSHWLRVLFFPWGQRLRGSHCDRIRERLWSEMSKEKGHETCPKVSKRDEAVV